MNRTLHLAIAASASCAVFPAVAMSAPPSSSTLQDFVNQYAQIGSIQASASVEYFLDPAQPACDGPAGVSILGTFSYSAKDGMWRSHSHLDHAGMTHMRTVVAYDGSIYQYHMLEQDVLAVSFGDDDRDAGFVLPNPLIAAAQFLVPITAQNESKEPRLNDVQAAAASTDLSTVTWTADVLSQHSLEYTDLPGGNHEGHEYIYRVFVSPENRSRPLRIDRIATTGQHLTRTLLGAYQDFGGGLMFPTSYQMILFNPENGSEAGRISMTMNAFEANTPTTDSLEPADFQLPWNLGSRVWLIENEVFVN